MPPPAKLTLVAPSLTAIDRQINENLLGLLKSSDPLPRFLMAISGGVDSMVLLHALAAHLPKANLGVAHFNHKLRRAQSDLDADLVAKTANHYEIDFNLGIGSGQEYSEVKLRKARLSFLVQTAKNKKYDFILTAHHADDQLETVLMRLIRGTGLDGLGAIPRRQGLYLRPMLDLTRIEISQFAIRQGINFREDASNQSLSYLRNRIRHQVVPPFVAIAQEFGDRASFLKRLVATTDELGSVSSELKSMTATIAKSLCVRTKFWTRFNRSAFLKLSRPQQLRLLRFLVAEFENSVVLDRSSATRLQTTIAQNIREGQSEGGVSFHISCGEVFLLNCSLPVVALEKSHQEIFCSDLGIRVKINDPDWIDFHARFFQPGDFQARHKLKRHFLEHRIPKPERSLLPLLVNPQSGETVWFFPQKNPGVTCLSSEFPFSFLKLNATS